MRTNRHQDMSSTLQHKIRYELAGPLRQVRSTSANKGDTGGEAVGDGIIGLVVLCRWVLADSSVRALAQV